MPLYFRDVDGREGVITDDLRVEYDGALKPVVLECLADAIQEHCDGDGEVDEEDVFRSLLLSLPERSPVVTVEVIGRD